MAFATPAKARAWDKFVSDCQASRAERQCDPESKSELRKDFYHWLWEAKDPMTGKGYSLGELNAECELLTIAGSDTTATVLSGLIFYLCRNPKVQERLAKELTDTFSSYDEIKAGAKLRSCRYLTAVIQEGMRMAPPVAADLPREILSGGTTIENHFIPQGILVGTSSWCMHYNPNHYPDPYRFQPERWILGEVDASEASVATAESAFFAFSFGSRNCVGKNMAWLEMRLVLAKALWRYEIKPDPNNSLGAGNLGGEWGRQCEEQYQTYDIFVADRKGPVIQLKERSHTLR
jgi:cytochrome P450